MKKYGGILLAFLALTAVLCACGSAPETEQSHTDHTETLMQDTTPDMVLPEDTLLSASESEQPQTQIADGKLRLLDYGTYSGLYPEDGSDEAVEQVAAILIENTSAQTCQYSQMIFTADGEELCFTLSELPAGESAWILADERQTVTDNAVFAFETDSSVFREAPSLTDISWQAGSGSITLTNTSANLYDDLYVYYKLCGQGGAYLGGVCYRVSAGALQPGETKTVPAGHFYEGACEVVGIYSE